MLPEDIAAREEVMAELDEDLQAQVDADIEYDRRNDDRSCEYEPRSAF